MTAKNDVTGDSIRTKVSNTCAYAVGWDRIFGKSKKGRAPSGSLGEPVAVKAVRKARAKNNSGIV